MKINKLAKAITGEKQMEHSSFESLLKEVITPQNFERSVQKIVFDPITVSKPKSDCFIMVHPEKCFTFPVLELDFDGERVKEDYLVTNQVAHLVQNELKVKNYHLYTTTDKVYGLWATRCESDVISVNKWIASAVRAKREAVKSWVRVCSNRKKQGYEVVKAEGDLGTPVWPEYSDEQILNFAFSDKIIDSENHHIIKKLRGEVL